MLVTDHETRVVDESYGSKAAAWRDERVGRLHTWKLADPEEDDGVIGEPLQKGSWFEAMARSDRFSIEPSFGHRDRSMRVIRVMGANCDALWVGCGY